MQMNHFVLVAEILLRLLNARKQSKSVTVTTNVSTATMLPISSSAGVTAAAGTRLALN